MLRYSLVFLLMAIVSAIVAFANIAPEFAFIAKIVFYLFLALLVISTLLSAFAFKKKHSTEGR